MPLKGDQLKITMREYLDEIRALEVEQLTKRQSLLIELGDNFIDLLLREERGRHDEPRVAADMIHLLKNYRLGMRNGELVEAEPRQ
jgi:hypothetical protein